MLKLFCPEIKTRIVPFDQIIPAILDGTVEAGLLIHEGQLTYANVGLHRVIDLGRWWLDTTELPLPLGGNVIRRDLEEPLARRVSHLLRASIEFGLEHREAALAYAHQFARDMDAALADKFVGMYVNDRTLGTAPTTRRRLNCCSTADMNRASFPTARFWISSTQRS